MPTYTEIDKNEKLWNIFCILFDMEKHLQQAGSNFREWSVSRTHIVHYYQMVNRFFFLLSIGNCSVFFDWGDF